MKEDTKTKKELLAENADLRRRLEVSDGLSQKANKNRIGREDAEEALKKAENGRKKAEDSLQESESRVTNLTSQLLLAEEKERKRIAHELHDSLGQSLSAIAFNVRTALQDAGVRSRQDLTHWKQYCRLFSKASRKLEEIPHPQPPLQTPDSYGLKIR